MTKSLAVLLALLTIGAGTQAEAADSALAQWEKCVAKIKKDMPIPPANQGAVDLTIQSFCGKKPAK